MKLLSVELRRFASRRANILFAAIGVLFLAGSLTVLAANSHKPTEVEVAKAEESAEEERETAEREIQECEDYWAENPDADPDDPDPADFEDGEVEDYGFDRDCQLYYEDPDTINASDYLGNVLSFAAEAPGQIGFLGVVFIVCALLMSGSFVGAEWTSGGMTNLLLWEPRRMLVYASKLTAALTSVLGLTLVTSVLHLGGLYLIALTRGEVGNLSDTWWQDNGTFALRLLALVAMATIWGFALSMIGRRTVVAIGSVIAYIVVIEYGISVLFEAVNVYQIQEFMLSQYLQAWVVGESEHMDYVDRYTTHMWEGGGVLLAVTAVLLAGSAALFGRRDTT